MLLDISTAIRILDDHRIDWYVESGLGGECLMVQDAYTFNGQPFTSWVTCPPTLSKLFAWLGY